MEYKKLIKANSNKSIASAKEEAASLSSEALTAMVFLPSSYHNRFGLLISDLRQ